MNQSTLHQLQRQFNAPETPGSIFLSFEGIEGSGKSTQIRVIEEYLASQGYRVLSLREPGGTAFGEKLRETVLSSEVSLHPLAECHLFLASRAQLMKEKILPFLLTPRSVVILDRYIDSTLAYQGKARGLGFETVLSLHRFNPLCLIPHRTYLLDISLQCSLQRQALRGQKKDYFEAEENEFHLRLIEGFHDAATLFPERIRVIDGARPELEVAELLCDDLSTILP